MKKEKIKVIVVLGPTSSGKSEMAVQLAKKFNGEIISADSRQIFKDMDLGTGKVEGEWEDKLQIRNYKLSSFAKATEDRQINSKYKTKNSKHKNPLSPPLKKGEENANAEMNQFHPDPSSASSVDKLSKRRGESGKVFVYEGVPHYLIDFVDPRDEYNVSGFKKDCERLIKEISGCGKLPIICGGTGFWILSVVNDIDFPAVEPNQELRNKLRNKTAEELHEELKKLDSQRAKTIDAKNKQRLIRAIEIAKKLGEVPNLDIFHKKENDKFQFLQIGIDCLKEDLENKIKKRLESRFLQGMIEEVKNLKEKNDLDWEKIQSFGLGYYWIPLFLQNKISKEELKQKVFEAERGYAKRQRTWLNKQKGIGWVIDLNEAEKLTTNFLE